jgi:O-antigen/teichoic acid export membrane protein
VAVKFVRLAMAPRVLALADQALVSGASFLTTVLIGRHTFPNELGTYALAGAVLIWVTNAQESLVSLPLTLRRSCEPMVAAVQASQALVLSGLLSALAIVAIVVAGLAMLATGDYEHLIPIAWALASAVPFVVHRDFARRFAFADLRNIEALALDSAIVFLQLGALGWLAWTDRMSSASALAALGLSCATAVLIWFWLVRARFQFSLDGFPKALGDSWTVGKWLCANQLLGALQSQMTLWFVALAVGTAATGIYTACLSIALFANPIILGISNVLWAKAAQAFQQGGSARLLRESIADAGQLGAIVGVFFIMILLWGDDLLRLLYPASEYAGHADVVTILALGQLIYGLGMPASTALASMGHVRTTFVISTIETILMGFLVWPLVLHWGIVGAAYAVLIGCIVRLFVRWAALLSLLRTTDQTMARANRMERLAPILRRLGPWTKPLKVEVLDLDGSQGHVFAATPDKSSGETDPAYIIKLYRPDRNMEVGEIRAQHESLCRLHATINGHVFHGWRICIPAPALFSEEPLALVMAPVPGRKLIACLHESTAAKGTEHPATLAFTAAMMNLWMAGLCHGDLNIANILCDEQTFSLSFVDCGPKSECEAYAQARSWRDLATHDLAHLLSHEAETLSVTWGRPNRLRRRQLFVEGVLRTVLAAEPTYADKAGFISELSRCARAHLAEPTPIYKRLGWWRFLKRNAALRRMNAILKRMEQEIMKGNHSVGDHSVGDGVWPNTMPQKMPQRRLMSRLAGRIFRDTRRMLGLSTFLRSEDRRILEQIILPNFISDQECEGILFVGCDWYTQGYNAWFEGKNYWTIDVNPATRKFGAKQHIVDGLQNISRYFPREALDLIVCNGVFGWGLDDTTAVEQAIRGCHEILRHGGILIIGVDGVEERRPYALENSAALRAFEPYEFPPLQTSDYLTDTPYRHRFLFYRKRLPVAGDGKSPGSDEAKVLLQETSSKTPPSNSRSGWRSQHWRFSEAGEAVDRIRKFLSAELKYLVGIDSDLENEDRRVLEKVIFPYFLNDDDYMNVLFVGCSWCTRAYNKRFEAQKNYSTIDRSPWKRRYGARQHIIGWDDRERSNPCPLSTWECLRGFRAFVFPPLRRSEFVTATSHRHTYSFYRRPRAAELADGAG